MLTYLEAHEQNQSDCLIISRDNPTCGKPALDETKVQPYTTVKYLSGHYH